MKPGSAIAGERDDRESAGKKKGEVDLPETPENPRSEKRHEDAARRSSRRDRQVEGGQPRGLRPGARQFAVEDHARGEQRGRIGGDLHADRHFVAMEKDDRRPAERAEKERAEDGALVEAVALEAEDEGSEVQAERQDPQEGDRGDLLAHLVGRRHEHRGAAGAEGKPEEEVVN